MTSTFPEGSEGVVEVSEGSLDEALPASVDEELAEELGEDVEAVSYTHLTLPTTPYV